VDITELIRDCDADKQDCMSRMVEIHEIDPWDCDADKLF
jgi:hypothetical protein